MKSKFGLLQGMRNIAFVFILCSCNGWVSKGNANSEKQWVYLEVESILKSDTSVYFYYGQINKSILEEIYSNPEASGLFALSNTRYTRKDDNLIAVYDDAETNGTLIFRIEDIQYVSQYKNDPIELFDDSELHESAIILKKRKIRTKPN